MKNVVIIGAGFGGLACAKKLLHLLKPLRGQVRIILIDKNDYHSVHGNLYEVASFPSELSDLRELKKTVAVPLAEIFSNQDIEIIKAEVTSINPLTKVVEAGTLSISYDFLVAAQGAAANYYDIPGASQYGLPLQSPQDALRIRNAVEQAIVDETYKTTKPIINIAVAGGGVSGVELAAELQGMIRFLAWQYNIPKHKVQTVILERADTVLPGFDSDVIQTAEARLKQLGIRVSHQTSITEVTDSVVKFSDQSSLNYAVLIWATGVKSCQLSFPELVETAKGGRVEVDEYFRIKGHNRVFVIGDQCCHHDAQGNPLPGTASQAIDQGEYVARTIAYLIRNQQPQKHKCRTFPMVITLGGKWAIFHSRHFNLRGWLGYFVRELVWFRYFASILGWRRGLHWLLRSQELYTRND